MHIVRKLRFGEVEAFELGFGPIGRPVMTVHFYYVDGILIDTGQSHLRKHIPLLLEGKECKTILLTHHHEDHSGNAAFISRIHGAKILGHPFMIEKMRDGYKILPYQHLIWGRAGRTEVLPLPPLIETVHHTLLPIHTPGHSKDHTVFLEKERGWLFSGDLYIGEKIKFFRSDEKMKDQIESLKKVLTHDFEALFCCHRPCPKNGKRHLERKLAYLEDFYGNIRTLAQKGYDSREIIRKTGQGKRQESEVDHHGKCKFRQYGPFRLDSGDRRIVKGKFLLCLDRTRLPRLCMIPKRNRNPVPNTGGER